MTVSITSNRQIYPEQMERTPPSSLIKPANNLRIILSDDSKLQNIFSLLKFTSSTDILDPLFFAAVDVNDKECEFKKDEIFIFEIKSRIITFVKSCQKWIEQEIQIIDGSNLSTNESFTHICQLISFLKDMVKYYKFIERPESRPYKIFTDINNCNTLLENYKETPSIKLASELQSFLIENIYPIMQIDFIFKTVIKNFYYLKARNEGSSHKHKIQLKAFHTIFFNTINSIRLAGSNSILNKSLFKELLNRHSDLRINYEIKDEPTLTYFKNFYIFFSTVEELQKKLCLATVPLRHLTQVMTPWNIAEKISLPVIKDSFYISVHRIAKLPYTFAPIDLDNNGCVKFLVKKPDEKETPFDMEWHNYQITEAVVWQKEEKNISSCFIEKFTDETGVCCFQKHQDDQVIVITQSEYVQLAKNAVLVRFKHQP